jgi:hypothetical protein
LHLVARLLRKLRPRTAPAEPPRAEGFDRALRAELACARHWAERTTALAAELEDSESALRRQVVLAALLATADVARRIEVRRRELSRPPLLH